MGRLPVSCRCEKRLVEVDVIGGSFGKVTSAGVGLVEGQILAERGAGFADRVVGSQVNLLVFDRSPKAFDEHIVPSGAAAV